MAKRNAPARKKTRRTAAPSPRKATRKKAGSSTAAARRRPAARKPARAAATRTSGSPPKGGKKRAAAGQRAATARKAAAASTRRASGPKKTAGARKTVASPRRPSVTPPLKQIAAKAQGPRAGTRQTRKVPAPATATAVKRRQSAQRRGLPLPRRTVINEESEEPFVETPTSFNLDLRQRPRTPGNTLEERLPSDPNSPEAIAAGDVDVNAESASAVGDETPGGDNPTPDMDIVDLIGRSLGVEYEDSEELRGAEKIVQRDRKRWELDPKSSEDYKDRNR